jgi:hypothetical protein
MNRNDQTFEELIEQMPLKDVFGIVSASGSGGWQRGAAEDEWTLIFECDGWRFKDGSVHTDELRVEMPVSKSDLAKYMKVIKPHDIIHLQAKVAEYPKKGMRAKAIRIVATSIDDADLAKRSKELQKPVCIKDTVLGDFVLDRSVKWFRGNPFWGGNKIHLELEVGEEGRVGSALEVARKLWKSEETWNVRVLDYAASKLLQIKNESWLADGESSLSDKEFKRRMKLETIAVSPDGSFEFWYNDGDMFGGHAILIRGSLKDGLKDAEIEG